VSESALQRLVNLIDDERVLLFVGAGLSAAVGYPALDVYVESLCDTFGEPSGFSDADDASAIADLVKHELEEHGREAEYLAHLETTFGVDGRDRSYSSAHATLIGCRFRGVVTANYDSVIEDAVTLLNAGQSPRCETLDLCADRKFAVFDFLRSIAARPTLEFVLHIHGYFRSPQRLILTTTDYVDAYGPYEQSPDGSGTVRVVLDSIHRKVLWTLLVTYPVLFVGFSLRDLALRHILQVVDTDFFRGRNLDHFAVIGAVDEDDETALAGELAAFGVTPIFYRVVRSQGLPDDHSNLEGVLSSLCTTSEATRIGDDFTARMLAQ
jgi:hypothetical protein